jgi:hypothetical protein
MFAVTPAGNPLTDMAIVFVLLLERATDAITDVTVPSAVRLTKDGLKDRLTLSGVDVLDEEPEQPSRNIGSANAVKTAGRKRIEYMEPSVSKMQHRHCCRVSK